MPFPSLSDLSKQKTVTVKRLQGRNVEVFDSDGAVIAGFWQYGTLQWDEFYRYIIAFTVTTTAWTIFQYDLAQQQLGAPCPSGAQIVQPGHYILLSNTGRPIRVELVPTLPRPRNPTHSKHLPTDLITAPVDVLEMLNAS
ncbi:hypothetical protein BJV74DRAFT_618825 [Russula compacta]|nr:hypothetical protein BJV74DRAFT_618825 [Russula compacta]